MTLRWMMGEMKPGRELDALVAEKVMGWHKPSDGVVRHVKYSWKTDKKGEWSDIQFCPNHSTDIAAAWEVVEKFDRNFEIWRNLDGRWHVTFGLVNKNTVIADTAPHAICLAALKAVGHE